MKRKLVSLLLSLSLMVVSVTGCQSDSVTEETKKEVQTKKSHRGRRRFCKDERKTYVDVKKGR